jgi:uncharacterized protein involved in response to NO
LTLVKQKHTPIPRYRVFNGPSILSQGYRPFFLLAGLWAVVTLGLSFEMILGRITLPTVFDAISWHYHEMLFGYVAAVIAGYILTTIPNWTGHLPLQGLPLLALVILWIAGRIAVAISEIIGGELAAVIDLSFLVVLALLTGREIVAGRNWRNLPIILVVMLFFLCNGLSHAEALGLMENEARTQRLAIALVVMLVCMVGGRIIPSFTHNWLAKNNITKRPVPFGNFDRLTLVVTSLGLGLWAIGFGELVIVALMGGASLLNLLRLRRWHGFATFPEPLLWALHIGYFWIPFGLALAAISLIWPVMPMTGSLHALTIGVIGTMTLAVMSRTTLRNTGRPPMRASALPRYLS